MQRLFSHVQVAALAGVSRNTVRNWADAGKIAYTLSKRSRVGPYFFFSKEEVLLALAYGNGIREHSKRRRTHWWHGQHPDLTTQKEAIAIAVGAMSGAMQPRYDYANKRLQPAAIACEDWEVFRFLYSRREAAEIGQEYTRSIRARKTAERVIKRLEKKV